MPGIAIPGIIATIINTFIKNQLPCRLDLGYTQTKAERLQKE
jgi:hypothetical protein